ncbi:sialidase family protein [Dermabacteraceae bacterium CCM 9519]
MVRHAVVAREGERGYARYRIPALTLTAAGGLLAVYDARAGVDDLPGPIDLVSRTSDDGGKTWGPQLPVRAGNEREGYGDACLLTLENGDVLLLHAASERAGFFESRPLSESPEIDADPQILQLDLLRSTDGGKTWQPAQRLTSAFYASLREAAPELAARVSGVFPSSGTGLCAGDGSAHFTLVMLAGKEIYTCILSSTDGGKTWRVGQVFGPDTNESALAEASDGSFVYHSRAVGCRKTSRNDGNGYAKLQDQPLLSDPGCNGSVLRWGNLLAATHLADPALRRCLAVDVSPDMGESWRRCAVITEAEAAYSTAVVLPDGALGVLWEAGGCRALVFTRVEAQACGLGSVLPDETPAASLRHIVPAPLPQGEKDLVLGGENAWGEGVYKIVSPGPQLLRHRDSLKGAVRQEIVAGDILVFDIRLPGGEVLFNREYRVEEADIAGDTVSALPPGLTEPVTVPRIWQAPAD